MNLVKLNCCILTELFFELGFDIISDIIYHCK